MNHTSNSSLAALWEHAQRLRQSGDKPGALRELVTLLERDPERGEAWLALAELYAAQGLEQAANASRANARALPDRAMPPGQAQAKAGPPRSLAATQAELETSRNQLSTTLAARAAWQAGQDDLASAICQSALYYWPDCIPLHLILADCLTTQGECELAVEHMRLAHALDPQGEVLARLAPAGHPLHGRWATMLAGRSAFQAPAAADAAGPAQTPGQHQLPASRPDAKALPASQDAPQAEPDSQDASQAEPDGTDLIRETLDQVVRTLVSRDDASRTPARRRTARKPFYAIISAREPLARVCGSRAAIVEQAMVDLAGTVASCDRMTCGAIFIDDAASLSPFGLAPVRAQDPAAIRQLLDELDDALGAHGFQLAAILIVGGDEIIPLHRLPNPTDDLDADVPTDVPYACRSDGQEESGESVLLPGRLVGRLPHGTGEPGAPDMLLLQLGTALETRVNAARAAGKSARSLFSWLPAILGRPADGVPVRSFGFAASIWRRAAQEVFSAIGPAQALRLSPPLSSQEAARLLQQTQAQLAYFNLHGLPDAPHWYGQRDPEFIADYATFPVALSPADVVGGRLQVVFTAACYGIRLCGCNASSSIALRFMQNGTLALVGSTATAYGGLDKPLLGVDLLGHLFWKNIAAGCTSGEALRQAQIVFANHMQQRQGYLDGEDQKTLSSFILLGDPLLVPQPARGKPAGVRFERQAAPPVPLVCAKGSCQPVRTDVPAEHIRYVRERIARALPDMAHAAIHVSRPAACGPGCSSGPGRLLGKAARGGGPVQVSLSKTLSYDGHRGVQLVRVTLDNTGKIVKMAMSK